MKTKALSLFLVLLFAATLSAKDKVIVQPVNACIEDCATGRKWFATDIKNGEFDKEIFMPDSGDSTFVLIFPKPDRTVTQINYLNNDDNDKTGIFGISLNPKTKRQSVNIVPPEVSTWLDGELANAKRNTLMNVDAQRYRPSGWLYQGLRPARRFCHRNYLCRKCTDT
jgi:hypothetical protein